MKNLATCMPREFIAQTAKIKDAIANFLDVTQINKIRAKVPAYKVAPSDASAEQKAEIIRENALIKKEQVLNNLNEILDQMLVKHPQETLEILALICFVEPCDVDNHSMDEYLQCIMEMMQSKAVMSFFSLLAQIDQRPKFI